MKVKELRDLSTDELKQQYSDLLKQGFNIKMTKTTGKVENPLQIRQIRRDIARIKTILNEKK